MQYQDMPYISWWAAVAAIMVPMQNLWVIVLQSSSRTWTHNQFGIRVQNLGGTSCERLVHWWQTKCVCRAAAHVQRGCATSWCLPNHCSPGWLVLDDCEMFYSPSPDGSLLHQGRGADVQLARGSNAPAGALAGGCHAQKVRVCGACDNHPGHAVHGHAAQRPERGVDGSAGSHFNCHHHHLPRRG